MAAQPPIPTVDILDISISPLHAYFQCSQNQSHVKKGFHFSTHCREDVGKLSSESHDDNLEVNETEVEAAVLLWWVTGSREMSKHLLPTSQDIVRLN